MTFSELLATARLDPVGALTLSVPARWMQGRSVFGGLQAAAAVRAMRVLVPQMPLRTLQATFLAPVAGELRAAARVLRTGKNTVMVEARIGEAEGAQALVTAVFGNARSSAAVRVPAVRASASEGTQVFEPPRDGSDGAPRFAHNFRVRWLDGGHPFAGDPGVTRQVLELGMDEPGPATESHVIALADFIPPVAFAQLRAPVPGSTLTWMLELLAERFDHLPLAGWRVEAELIAARDGYTSQALTLFGPGGVPIARGNQSMLVFG
jgi:acyl-CoA thioesterase